MCVCVCVFFLPKKNNNSWKKNFNPHEYYFFQNENFKIIIYLFMGYLFFIFRQTWVEVAKVLGGLG